MLESADNVAVGGVTKGSRMVIVGLGGGGCNAVARMHAGWSDGPVVAAVNISTSATRKRPMRPFVAAFPVIRPASPAAMRNGNRSA